MLMAYESHQSCAVPLTSSRLLAGRQIISYLTSTQGLTRDQHGRVVSEPLHFFCLVRDGKPSWGHTSSNRVEGFNSRLAFARRCTPLVAMITVTLLVKRQYKTLHRKLLRAGGALGAAAANRLQQSERHAEQLTVRDLDRPTRTAVVVRARGPGTAHTATLHPVGDAGPPQRYRAECTCRVPQVYGVPCGHAVILAIQLRVRPELIADKRLTKAHGIDGYRAAGTVAVVRDHDLQLAPLGTPDVKPPAGRRPTKRRRSYGAAAGNGVEAPVRGCHLVSSLVCACLTLVSEGAALLQVWPERTLRADLQEGGQGQIAAAHGPGFRPLYACVRPRVSRGTRPHRGSVACSSDASHARGCAGYVPPMAKPGQRVQP